MGAMFMEVRLEAKDDISAMKEVEAIADQCRYEYGHGGYTGTFAEACGVEINKAVRPKDYNEAVDWLEEHCRKWGPVVIVKTMEGEYVSGAWCSC